MAATDEMVAIALKTHPHAACIVPERRENAPPRAGSMLPVVRSGLAGRSETEAAGASASRVHRAGPAADQNMAAKAGLMINRTGTWCDAVVDGHGARAAVEFERIAVGARLARKLGLEVHAGHSLDYVTAEAISALPEIVDLNIGHYMMGEAVFSGLADVVKKCGPRWSADESRQDRPDDHWHRLGPIDITRVEKVIERHGDRFLSRIFTDVERARAERRANQARKPTPSVSRPRKPAARRSARGSERRVVAGYGCGIESPEWPADHAADWRCAEAAIAGAAGLRGSNRPDHQR